jgi:hypothetical protein
MRLCIAACGRVGEECGEADGDDPIANPASRVERARMLLAYRANSSFFAAGAQEQYLEHTHLAIKTTNLRK